MIATRQSLLTRLKNRDDSEGWRIFFDTYWKLIYGFALKFGLSDDEAQEVVQETVIGVAKYIESFKYKQNRGSFKSWLLRMTRWRISDQVRKRFPSSPGPPSTRSGEEEDTKRTTLVDQIPDPASLDLNRAWNEDWQKNLMDAAMERVKQKVKPKQYQMFDLYVIKEWPVDVICRSLGVSVGQVYIAKHRVASLIKKEIKTLEKLPI
jgi:RNA polymerase sigma factor (sigma-70 family)